MLVGTRSIFPNELPQKFNKPLKRHWNRFETKNVCQTIEDSACRLDKYQLSKT